MSDELKPCPFCGAGATVEYSGACYWVGCFDCGADGPENVSHHGAIAAWNRRAPQPATGGGIDIARMVKAFSLRSGREGTHYEGCEYSHRWCAMEAMLREIEALRQPQPATAAGVMKCPPATPYELDRLCEHYEVVTPTQAGSLWNWMVQVLDARKETLAKLAALAGCSPGGGGGDGWIACSRDTMPKDSARVLVHVVVTDTGAWTRPEIAHWMEHPLPGTGQQSMRMWQTAGGQSVFGTVTHWRPLPPAPAQQEKP